MEYNVEQPTDPEIVDKPKSRVSINTFSIGVVIICLVIIGTIAVIYKQSTEKQTKKVSQVTSPTIAPSPTIIPPPQPENMKAITDTVEMSYWLYPPGDKIAILKQIDFQTNKSREYTLPHPETTRIRNDYAYYKVSPNGKYVARISNSLLGIAELQETVHFKTIFDASTHVAKEILNYARISDIFWDDNGRLYFIMSMGLDGVGPAPGTNGYYSDIYRADANGLQPVLINDHTNENEMYSIGRKIYAVDTTRNELYISSQTHGGHIGIMDVVNITTGEIVRSLKEQSSDAGNPVFTKDFSNGYYIKSLVHSDGYLPTHLYKYERNSGGNTLIYTVQGYTAADNTPSFGRSGTGLSINNEKNLLYFEEENNKMRQYYSFDPATKQKNLLYSYDEKNGCWPEKVSNSGKYLLLFCDEEVGRYQIYNVETKASSLFYKGSLEVIDFH